MLLKIKVFIKIRKLKNISLLIMILNIVLKVSLKENISIKNKWIKLKC